MDLLDRFEKAVEGLWEGVFTGLFPSPLQPIEVGKRLAREMEAHRTRAMTSTLVPNVYLVALAPATYEKFIALAPKLLIEMESFLQQYAAAHDYETVGPFVVELKEDESLKPNDARISVGNSPKALGHAAPPPATAPAVPAAAPAPAVEETVVFAAAPVLEVVEGPDAGLRMTARHGMTIGRGTTCDLALTDSAVSRVHAEIVKETGFWYLHDLGSRNHTFHNGKQVEKAVLRKGDKVMVGETVILVG
jgi:hypothetical protein